MTSLRTRLTHTLAGCACALLLVTPSAALAKGGGGSKPAKPAKPAKAPASAELVAKARAAFEAKLGSNGTLESFTCKKNGSKKVTCRAAGAWTGADAADGSTFKGRAQAEVKCRKSACTVRATAHIVVSEPEDGEDVLSGGGSDDAPVAIPADGEPALAPGAGDDLPGRPSHPFDEQG